MRTGTPVRFGLELRYSSFWLHSSFVISCALALALLLSVTALAQDDSSLQRNRFRNGEETLRSLAPISEATRNSIVKFNVNGETVALGCVVDSAGLALTKASELKPGKLTCWLATEKEVEAEVVASDEDEDVALVRVHAKGLKPIPWATDNLQIGQWAITPGIAATPHAIGIISALPRRIRPPRAYIGVTFDFTASSPRIGSLRQGFGAEKAGLKVGDVVVGVNGTTVTNREQIVDILREFKSGQSVHLRVEREADDFEVDVQLSAPTADQIERGDFPAPRSIGMAGGVSRRAEGFEQAIEHDTVLRPYLCGGPLVNLDGKAIGLNIARADRAATYALPAKLVKRIVEDLKSKAHPAASS